MCLAIPARIISVAGEMAQVEVGGVRREVGMHLVPEAKVGDYVLIHTGYAIGVIDEQEAQETLRLISELELYSRDQEPQPRDEISG